jgi:hypothetical protein
VPFRTITPRGRFAAGFAIGCLLFSAACFVPGIGLFRGRIDTGLFQHYGDSVLAGAVPYRDFSLEYPPGALPAFVVPSLGPARSYDTWFSAFEVACGLAVVAGVAWALSSLRATPARVLAGVALTALAPLALGPLTLHRYDLWAVAFAVAGVAALVGGHRRLAFGALAAGTAAKVFPVALLPLALLHVGRRFALRGLAWYLGVLIAIVGPFCVLAPGGVASSLGRQAGRSLQIETVASSALLVAHALGTYEPHPAFGDGSWNLSGTLPDALAALSTAVEAVALVAVWALYARGPRTRSRLVLASAAALTVWVACGGVLSPQYLLWLIAPVALLRPRRYALLLLAALGLTQAVYPGRYDALVALRSTPIALLAARNVLLVVTAALLVRELHGEHVAQQVGGEDERRPAGDDVVLDGGERQRPDGVPGLQP